MRRDERGGDQYLSRVKFAVNTALFTSVVRLVLTRPDNFLGCNSKPKLNVSDRVSEGPLRWKEFVTVSGLLCKSDHVL